MAEKNPWATHSAELKYDNPWIEVTEYQVTNPSGGAGIYGVVSFKNLAIAVIPVDAQDRTVLVGQYRYPLQQYSWEIVEGGGPVGIDPLTSAQRELVEETGYHATHYREIQRLHLSNSVSDELGIIYVATGLTKGASQPDATEELRLKHVAVDEAIEMVERGAITDALSVAGLLRLDRMRRRGEL